ncbi:MAG: zinc ribbon domain-containing protein [Ruminococcaceae bacterium]|nr:zinc ribbon domain-containing protein [Oscillospiraceae bacterium]
MKTCPSCGRQLPDESSFCMHCMTQLVPVTEVNAQPQKQSGKRVLICLLGVLCAALTAAVLILALRPQPEPDFSRYEQTISKQEDTIREQEDTISLLQTALLPTDEEQYSYRCEELIASMDASAERLGIEYEGCFDSRYVLEAGSVSDLDTHVTLQTHLLLTAGDVFIQYAHKTDYVKCEILGVPDRMTNPIYYPSEDAFRIMQVLYTTRTGKTGTALYEFVSDHEKYPLSEENVQWAYFNDHTKLWFDSVVDDNTKVSVMRKDGEFGGLNVTLHIRTRQYGQTTFYDYLFTFY